MSFIGLAIEGFLSPGAKYSITDLVLGALLPPLIVATGALIGSKLMVGIYLYFLHWVILFTGMRSGRKGIVTGWIIGTILMILSLPIVALELYPSLS